MCLATRTHAHALAFSAGACDKGRVGRLRDFESIVDFLSEEEIDEMQAAIDGRRETSREESEAPEDGRAAG